MYIPQYQLKNLTKMIAPQKAVIVYGPRRCGKTTLLEHFVKDIKEEYLLVNGEDITVQDYLSSRSIEKLKSFVGNRKLLLIDEAQRVTFPFSSIIATATWVSIGTCWISGMR